LGRAVRGVWEHFPVRMWRHARRVDPVTPPVLADGRGVYVLANADGVPLFVGGSASLRRRAEAYRCSRWLTTRDEVDFAPIAPGRGPVRLTSPDVMHELPQPMDEPRFWNLLAEAKLIGPAESGLRTCLDRRDPQDVAAFVARWQSLLTEMCAWRLWEVAYVVRGGCSDDSFEYFRSWIISHGESVANAAREDPVRWAMTLGRSLVPLNRFDFDAELVSYIGFDVYATRTRIPLKREWPEVGLTPTGTKTVEAEIFDTYPELTHTWHPPAS
jgi:hypothetical protein